MNPVRLLPLFAAAALLLGAGCGGHGGGSSAARIVAAPTVSSASTLPTATAGVPYAVTLTATGGQSPYVWTLGGSVTLPAGLLLDSVLGTITGTPTTAGTTTITAVVTGLNGASSSTHLTITVLQGLPTITTAATLPQEFVGVPFGITFTATGAAPITWSLTTGALPGGVTFSAAGALTGDPTGAGTFAFTVQAHDGLGRNATEGLSVTITALNPGIIYAAFDAPPLFGPTPTAWRLSPADGVAQATAIAATTTASLRNVGPQAGMYFDPVNNQLYLTNGGSRTGSPRTGIFVYGTPNSSLSLTFAIADANLALSQPTGVAYDAGRQILYVSDYGTTTAGGDGALRVYDNISSTASGVVQATGIIQGVSTNCDSLDTICLDIAHDMIFAANLPTALTRSASIAIFHNAHLLGSFNNTSPQNVTPDALLTGAATQIGSPAGLAYDPTRDLLYVVVEGGNVQNQPMVLVFDHVSTLSGTQNVAPLHIILPHNLAPGLQVLNQIALYPQRDQLYLTSEDPAQPGILVFNGASTAGGDTVPTRTITDNASWNTNQTYTGQGGSTHSAPTPPNVIVIDTTH